MALPHKAVGLIIVVLAIIYSLEHQGYRTSLNGFIQKLMGTKASDSHVIEKRVASLESSEYVFQAVFDLSQLGRLRAALSTNVVITLVKSSVVVTNIKATTVCYTNATGFQCVCEESFAWSYNNCIAYNACDAITGDTCGCITMLPADGQYCQANSTPSVAVETELVVEVNIPVSNISSSDINVLRENLRSFGFPFTVSQSLTVTAVNLTTACYPNATKALQCHCEEQFAWSCDRCKTYGVCGNLSTHTCGCINGVPSDGGLCEPITSVSSCPTPPPVAVEAELVVEVNIPVSNLSSSDINVLRENLRRFSFPFTVNQSLNVSAVNLTTACYPNPTKALQCHCEQHFAWSCDRCKTYGVCGNLSTHTCGCINGVPSDGGLCEPITSVSPCPTAPPVSVEADLVLQVTIPVSSISSSDINVIRETLRNISFSFTVNPSLNVTAVNLTTACYPNPTKALQCHCEEHFAWSCDRCKTYGVCGNLSTHTCGCINGVPSDGGLCEPITNVSPCPTSTPATTNTSMTPSSPTPTPTTNTSMTPSSPTPTPSTNTSMTPSSPTPTPTTNTSMTPSSPTPTPTTNTSMTPSSPTPTPTTNTSMTPSSPTPTPTTNTSMTPSSSTPTPTTNKPITPSSPTSLTPPLTTTFTEKLSVTMAMDYNPAFNNPSNTIYQDVEGIIQRQSKRHIPKFISAKLIGFSNGSTIVNYEITASSLEQSEIKVLETGLFTEMAESFVMIWRSSTSTAFDPPFLGQKVTLTCGPIPPILNFNGTWDSKWRHNGELISADSRYSFKKNSKTSETLTVSRFLDTDQGEYECRLQEAKRIFRQTSNKVLVRVKPSIEVTPLSKNIKCELKKKVDLKCSVNAPYKVKFEDLPDVVAPDQKISYTYEIAVCPSNLKFSCQVDTLPGFSKEVTLGFLTGSFLCNEDVFGAGNLGDTSEGPCGSDEVGERIAECQSNGTWEVVEENCVLKPIKDLLDESEFLTNGSLTGFLERLRNVTLEFNEKVVESSPNINATVEILNNVAKSTSSLNILISETQIKDILLTSGVLTENPTRPQWEFLNSKSTAKTSVTERNRISKAQSANSLFLLSLETLTSNLNNNSFDVATPRILLNKTTFTNTFSGDFNSSVEINIPEANGRNKSIAVMTFTSMDNVLPARDKVNSTLQVINGKVVLVHSSGTVNNVSFTFDIVNKSLGNPQCVFWNFTLFDDLGGWDDKGCNLTFNVNDTVTCTCNHLTSFSILMSPFVPNFPLLDYITYIGVSISMASLVICLIIEAVIWRKIRKSNTSYLRHVSIVNIALSLLIANIWFIIGAAISDTGVKNKPACTAATFFIHFFYLALFFWMFASAMLLLYRTVSVFGGNLSKHSLLIIGFCVGYGAPLIITVVTIAATAPSDAYIREREVCWLNWSKSMALLAFVIPALSIVVINLGILLVVLYKMLRRRAVVDAAQASERNAVVVIARTVAFLTPFFGLTWGLGVGTMTDPHNDGIHIAFAFFNSLQGFFILLFGTLLDKKVLSEISLMSQTSGSGTRSTSGGTSSSNGLGMFRRWRRDGYNLPSHDSGASHSFGNT